MSKLKKLLFSRKAFAMPYAVFMVLFILLPLALIIFYAFSKKQGDTLVFSLANFGLIFKPEYISVFMRSVLVGLITTGLCLIIGYPIAYLLSNPKYNRSSTLYMMFILPMWINFLLRTVATKELFYYLNIQLGGLGPVIFGMVYNFLPFMVLPIYTTLSKMDKNLIEASIDLGANNFKVFTKTIVPLSVPGVISGIIMVFMPSISTYVVSDLLSYNKISLFGNIINNWILSNEYGVGSALALIMLLIIGASMLITNKYDKLGQAKEGNVW